MFVKAIWIYPIKSTAAIDLPQADLRRRGLAHDRRWVVVGSEGQFLHQRIHPSLATVSTQLRPDGGLQLAAPESAPLHITRPAGDVRSPAVVWGDTVEAADAGDEAADWFSRFLDTPCRLMFMDQRASRPVPAPYGTGNEPVSFADALPLLAATEASLDDLNRRMEQPLPMSRFRPNLLIDGDAAWCEDRWKRIRVGDVEFTVTHPCVRCVITTIDQETGRKSASGEPLKTLATFRRNDEGGVLFGQNLLPDLSASGGSGMIRVGDRVEVLPTQS